MWPQALPCTAGTASMTGRQLCVVGQTCSLSGGLLMAARDMQGRQEGPPAKRYPLSRSACFRCSFAQAVAGCLTICADPAQAVCYTPSPQAMAVWLRTFLHVFSARLFQGRMLAVKGMIV